MKKQPASIAPPGRVLFPVLYAVGGFIGGIIAAAVYHLAAQWTGGLEFEVRDSA